MVVMIRRSNDGSTPVHAAAFSCLPSLLRYVIDYGGDLRLHDYQDLLPKDWALEAGLKRSKRVGFALLDFPCLRLSIFELLKSCKKKEILE